MRCHRLVTIVVAAGLVAACGGSSTAPRARAQPPAAAPNADIGTDAASRDAALRRQDVSATPPAPAEPPPDGALAPDR